MVQKIIYLILPVFLFTYTSCTSNQQKLLAKKWDCVKVENLAPVNKNFLDKEDSLVTAKLETALQDLSWTFNADNTYRCTALATTTVTGTYAVDDEGKSLTCTTTNNNIIRYSITTLTEQELVLKGYTSSVPVILHFRAH